MNHTVSEALGSTPHVSPLLRKVRRLGLGTPAALLGVAVRRGCTHYAPPDYDPARVVDPGPERLSNLEIAIAMCSAAQQYDPFLIRCAAQLLSGGDISAGALARVARMERCEPVIRHIANAAAPVDLERETFWREVLRALPACSTPRPGILPHASRFMIQTGITGPTRVHAPRQIWLRPRLAR